MTLARPIAILIIGAAGVVVAIAFVARVSDGPIGPIAGGPFRTGERMSESRVDWQSLASAPEVELQLIDPPSSRTTHLVVLDGHAYVPSGIVKVGPFVFLGQAFWKKWPYQALKDPRVILRSNGRLYEGRAVKVTDPELHRRLTDLMSTKYGLHLTDSPDSAKVWFFRLEPREV